MGSRATTPSRKLAFIPLIFLAFATLGGCSTGLDAPTSLAISDTSDVTYRIGAGDTLQVFVWRNPDLSILVTVRPDGMISVPLIDDLPVSERTPTQAARAIEEKLTTFIKDPVVTVIMNEFIGPADRQIRVVGEATQPLALPYRKGLTVMDVLIEAGGLTQYADGNDAKLVRTIEGTETTYRVRLDDLMNDGDLSANAAMAPGDILLIPQSWF